MYNGDRLLKLRSILDYRKLKCPSPHLHYHPVGQQGAGRKHSSPHRIRL